jgi:hypothetical protein
MPLKKEDIHLAGTSNDASKARKDGQGEKKVCKYP